MPKFVVHDLHREIATRLGGDDIDKDLSLVEKKLKHQLQAMQRIYNLKEYVDKGIKVLSLWNVKLMGWLGQ